MKKLELENITYEWNEKDTFEKDGKAYQFASLKKVSTFKNNKKYQTVTVRPGDLHRFIDFLKDIVGGSKDEEVPF